MADEITTTDDTTDETETEKDPERDAIEQMLGSVSNHMGRMQKHPAADVQALSRQVSGTVMEFIKDLVQKHLDLYDVSMNTFDDVEERLLAIEAGVEGPSLSEDETAKLAEFVGFCNKLIDTVLPTLEGDVKTETERMRALGTECEAIIAALGGEGEEDEDDEPEESDGSEGGPN